MAKLEIPAAPRMLTTQYTTLKGVDFSVSAIEVDRQHSPDMLNMISDEGGNPVKRKGWRRLHAFTHYNYSTGEEHVPDAFIFDIHTCKDEMFVATNNGVYKTNGDGIWSIVAKRQWTRSPGNIYNIDFEFGSIRLFSYNGKVWAVGHGEVTGTKTGSASIHTTGIFYCPVEDIADDMLMAEASNVWGTGIISGLSDPDPRHTIPEIITSRKPDGTGGVMLDSAAVNLATPFRIASFLGDDSSTQYNLYPTTTWTEDLYKNVVIICVEVKDANGVWQVNTGWTRPTTRTVTAYDRNGLQTSFLCTDPYITFTAPHAPVPSNEDNVRITYMPVDSTLGTVDYTNFEPGEFTPDSESTVAKGIYNQHLASLCHTDIVKNYGYSNNDRIFSLADGNRVYYTAAGDPSNIPDDNYILVSNTSAIVGLHRFDDKLVAITGNTDEEASVYFVSGAELQDGSHTFAVKASSVTVGAIAPESFVPLIDEPLFVSRTGIYCINSHYASTRMAVRNRSMYINKKLTAEENIKQAVATEWNNYYLLAVPGTDWKCYVLDGRQSSRDRKNNTDYSYECYVLNNIPASQFGKLNGELYFALHPEYENVGATLCKMNTDIDNQTAYEDDGTLADGYMTGGDAIYAYWSSKHDHESSLTQFKTLNKKGNVLILKPELFTSVDVYYQVDGEEKRFVGTFAGSSLYWTPIDFSDLTFRTDADTRDLFVKKKIKKYKTLRVFLENGVIDEPFGIVSFVKTYTIGNFAK